MQEVTTGTPYVIGRAWEAIVPSLPYHYSAQNASSEFTDMRDALGEAPKSRSFGFC